MAEIVCQVISREDAITLTWSEGAGSFDPYRIEGQALLNFRAAAKAARDRLCDLVKDYLNGSDEDVHKSSLELAKAGFKLSSLIFRPDAGPSSRVGKLVKQWLEDLVSQGQVQSVEIILDGPCPVPWNVIYNKSPDEAAFLRGDDSVWGQFWGIRYNLAANRRVEPLRRLPLLQEPKVLLVIDKLIRDGLPDDQKTRLMELAVNLKLPVAHSRSELTAAMGNGRPDLIYFLCHADPTSLILDDEPIGPNDLLDLLRGDEDDPRLGGIAFFNACQTAEASGDGSFLDAMQEVGLSGIIATEQQTVDTFANPLGIDFLEAFLTRNEPVGTTLQKLRGRVPLGLLYGTYCPPNIRVRKPSTDATTMGEVPILSKGRLSGSALAITAETVADPPLPESPYRSLAFYDRADRALFVGRDADVARFTKILDDSTTRVILLHGESGAGKSSFLRAGVIPFLEEECVGYRFCRITSGGDETSAALFVRATQDLPGQLAVALSGFCAQPLIYKTPLGETVEVDLPGVLARNTGAVPLRTSLAEDPARLGRIMTEIADRLPFAPILVIDQCEEVFTLAEGPEAESTRNISLEILRRTAGIAGNFKVIVALRTEYYGRLIDRLRRGRDLGGIREYLLTDFDEGELIEVIRRPTSEVPIRHAFEIPFQKYKFRYASGVPEEVVRSLIGLGSRRRDSALPLVQVVCVQLYEIARKRDDATVKREDFVQIGGVEGGLKRHAGAMIAEICKSAPADIPRMKAMFRQLYLTQSDGSLTTALLPEEELAHCWKGRMPFGKLVQAAVEKQLLRVNSLRIGDGPERRYVSLGHDALAKVAVEWDRELRIRRRARIWRISLGAAVASFVLMGLFALHLAREARENARLARRNDYQAQLDAAAAAWSNGHVDRLRSTLDGLKPKPGEEDLRSFEWYFINRLAGEKRPDPILPAGIRRVDACRDGGTLALVLADGSMVIWDVMIQKAVWELKIPSKKITCAAISPDGWSVATGGLDEQVRLWDIKTKKQVVHLQDGLDQTISLAYSADGHFLAGGDKGGRVRVWNVKTGHARYKWNRPGGWVFAIAMSPDGHEYAYSTAANIYVQGPGEEPHVLQLHHSNVVVLKYSRDGKRLAAGHRNGAVVVWDVASRQARNTFYGHEGEITSLSFGRGDHILASGGRDSIINTWNIERFQQFGQVRGHTGTFVFANFLETGADTRDFDGQSDTKATLLTVSDGKSDEAPGEYKTWTMPLSQDSKTLRGDGAEVWDMDISDGDRLISGSRDGLIKEWTLPDGPVRRKWTTPHDTSTRDMINSVAISPDGRWLVSGGDSGILRIWDRNDPKDHPWKQFHAEQKEIGQIRFLSDSTHFVSTGGNSTVKLWDRTLGEDQQPQLLAQHQDTLHAPWVAVRGSRVASAGEDGVIYLWDQSLGRRKLLREDGRATLNSVAFSNDGKMVAVGDARGVVQLWDYDTGKFLKFFPAHVSAVQAIAFSRDDRRLATGGDDKAVRLWDVESHRILLTLISHTDAVTALCFTSDDGLLASSSEDGSIRIWEAPNIDKPTPAKPR